MINIVFLNFNFLIAASSPTASHLLVGCIAITIEKELTTYHTTYYKLDSYFLIMAEIALVDYFVMGEAVGIVTFIAAFYYSRKQMQKLSTDMETKVLSDLDDKMNDLTQIAID